MMFHSSMSNSPSLSGETTCISCSAPRVQEIGSFNISPLMLNSVLEDQQQPHKAKKKRNLPGNPDPDAEVIALSPRTLLATNRFVCEVCNKGFQRDQNLQLHRRGHNLPWKLKQRNGKETKKRVYVCPDPTCIHHHPSRALGDLTGIKKHFCRKHGEKKWKCEKCSKVYAVQSDWKAHSKTCGTREYRCDCGTIFSRKDSFITHRAFCDALAEESARLTAVTNTPLFAQLSPNTTAQPPTFHYNHPHPPPLPSSSIFPFSSHHCHVPIPWDPILQNPNPVKYENPQLHQLHMNTLSPYHTTLMTPPFHNLHHVGTTSVTPQSATALLQKAASVGASGHVSSTMANLDMHASATWQKSTNHLTRDFLGLTEQCGGSEDDHGARGSASRPVEMLSYTEGVEYHSLMKHNNNNQAGFGFVDHQTCSDSAAAWGDC